MPDNDEELTEGTETEDTEDAEVTEGTVAPESGYETTALNLMKARLNRLQCDTSLDIYLQARLDAAAGYLEGIGIHLTDSMEDLLLHVDFAVWQYQNRDKPGAMPDWLRLQRRERWLREKSSGDTDGTEADTDDSGQGNLYGISCNGCCGCR